MGGGSKIGQNYQQIVLKKLPTWGRGVSKIRKNCRHCLWMVPNKIHKCKEFWIFVPFQQDYWENWYRTFFAIMFGFELALHWTENKKEWWSMTSNVLLLCLVFSLPLVKPTQGKNQMLTISSGIFTIFPHTAASDANSLQF